MFLFYIKSDRIILVSYISGTVTRPVSFSGYVFADKKVVQIYDYVDAQVPVLLRMYEKRIKGYSAIGYSVQENKKSSCPF